MKLYETIEADGFEAQSERYKKIEAMNHTSFLMVEGSPLKVLQSLHSVGLSREKLSPNTFPDSFDEEVAKRAREVSESGTGRDNTTGNVSPLGYGPKELSKEERVADGKKNVHEFLRKNNIDPTYVRVLKPERDYTTPLTAINLDEETFTADPSELLQPDTNADLIYTYNPNLYLAARPADCPIVFVTAETPKGSVTVLLHLASLGVAHGYIPQAKEILDELGVDWDTARIQITPGGQAETYLFTDFDKYDPRTEFPDSKGLYVDVVEKEIDGKKVYDYGIDLPAEAYEKIVEFWEVDPYQVFLDTTDTTSPTAGYSSRSRSFRGYEVNGDDTRDLVIAGYERK